MECGLGPSDASFNPLAPQTLRRLVPDLARRAVYLCGRGMTVAAVSVLVQAGVPQKRIHTESFAL
ncbi:hypothetical protein [Streptomyces sp. NPDC006510]|uniref:hypothetical protein n=1 Tax=Streptomyces sp. NPDC006510 TaxID=3155600 RepID=UPI00339EDAAA